MPGILRVDSDTTRALSEKLRSAGSTLDSALRQLAQTLYAIGQCWGSDAVGHEFSQQYGPGKENLLKGCDELVTVLWDLADRVEQSMTGYEHVETTNTYNAGSPNVPSVTAPTIPSVPPVPDATPVTPSTRGRR
jgi:uncharacterized protein YukE